MPIEIAVEMLRKMFPKSLPRVKITLTAFESTESEIREKVEPASSRWWSG